MKEGWRDQIDTLVCALRRQDGGYKELKGVFPVKGRFTAYVVAEQDTLNSFCSFRQSFHRFWHGFMEKRTV